MELHVFSEAIHLWSTDVFQCPLAGRGSVESGLIKPRSQAHSQRRFAQPPLPTGGGILTRQHFAPHRLTHIRHSTYTSLPCATSTVKPGFSKTPRGCALPRQNHPHLITFHLQHEPANLAPHPHRHRKRTLPTTSVASTNLALQAGLSQATLQPHPHRPCWRTAPATSVASANLAPQPGLSQATLQPRLPEQAARARACARQPWPTVSSRGAADSSRCSRWQVPASAAPRLRSPSGARWMRSSSPMPWDSRMRA